jgi:putative membrane protein insertion efficiency factor
MMLGLIAAYRLAVSPWLGRACRFTPSCSAYAEEAIRLHGPARGAWLAMRRLLRCHPWGGSGWDPVPKAIPAPYHERPANGPACCPHAPR